MVVAALALAGCAPPEPPSTQGKLQVVTTVGMIRDVVQNVGGAHVQAVGLMGPGVDPHLYKASEGDVRRLFRADVVFYGGLHLEAKMAEVLEEMGGTHRVGAVPTHPARPLLSPRSSRGAYDPHVWFDVSMWEMTVDTIASTLAAADPRTPPPTAATPPRTTRGWTRWTPTCARRRRGCRPTSGCW
jgi:manganese/zinc/iron transport system substrate-binding protein